MKLFKITLVQEDTDDMQCYLVRKATSNEAVAAAINEAIDGIELEEDDDGGYSVAGVLEIPPESSNFETLLAAVGGDEVIRMFEYLASAWCAARCCNGFFSVLPHETLRLIPPRCTQALGGYCLEIVGFQRLSQPSNDIGL